MLSFNIATAVAQPVRDRVTLLDEKTGSRTVLACTIVDYTGEFLRYKIREDSPTTVKPAAQVVSIETPQTRPHIEALEKYQAGDTKAAARLFEEALTQEPRGWVRRDILAMLVRCALRSDNYAQAGDRFLLIYSSDKTTDHIRGMPLSWTTAPPTPALKTTALNWQAQNNSAAKLLAASALLFEPKYQSSAKLDLQRLRSDRDGRIAQLATAQLWRLDVQDRKIADATVAGWKQTIQNLPEELRGGPYFVLGEAYRYRREYDLAAMSLLWLPLVYDHNYQLSALACLNAAESLKAIGQTEEAIALYREIQTRYGQSSYAQDAKQILDSLKISPADSEDSKAIVDP